MEKILVVDDDKEIRKAINIYLSNEGYFILEADNGESAIEILSKNDISLILMDIMMPKLNGIDTIIKVRKEKQIPIIVISAKTENDDIVLGLNVGADDYILKPFNFVELIARVKANIRRYVKYEKPNNENELEVNGLKMNLDTKVVTVENREILLTPKEFNILKLLMETPNKIFSLEEIYQKVWNEDYQVGDGTIAVHIRKIREKIEANPKNPIYLKVVWGVGYKIVE